MSGGKSKSSSSSSQSTQQASVGSLNSGQVAQGTDNAIGTTNIKSGGAINIGAIEQIPDGVTDAFSKIIETVNKSLDVNKSLTEGGQKIISDTTAAAIQSVGQRAESATQPDLSTITKLVPVMMLGIIAVGLIAVFKK